MPRDLAGGEYQDLKEMPAGLAGTWAGTGIRFVCEGTEEEILGEMEKFSVMVPVLSKSCDYRDQRRKVTFSVSTRWPLAY